MHGQEGQCESFSTKWGFHTTWVLCLWSHHRVVWLLFWNGAYRAHFQFVWNGETLKKHQTRLLMPWFQYAQVNMQFSLLNMPNLIKGFVIDISCPFGDNVEIYMDTWTILGLNSNIKHKGGCLNCFELQRCLCGQNSQRGKASPLFYSNSLYLTKFLIFHLEILTFITLVMVFWLQSTAFCLSISMTNTRCMEQNHIQ